MRLTEHRVHLLLTQDAVALRLTLADADRVRLGKSYAVQYSAYQVRVYTCGNEALPLRWQLRLMKEAKARGRNWRDVLEEQGYRPLSIEIVERVKLGWGVGIEVSGRMVTRPTDYVEFSMRRVDAD